MTFRHFIITRFNLPLWPTKEKDPIHNLDYLRRRMQLFEDYCFPSVRQQTCQDFTWLCLFDVHTPDEIKARLETLRGEYANFVPLYLDVASFTAIPPSIVRQREAYDAINSKLDVPEVQRDDKEYVERVQRLVTPAFLQGEIFKRVPAGTDWVLTTRLDNDDALHKTFVSEVQRHYAGRPGGHVLNFLNGYQCFLHDNIVFRNKFRNNHFTTLAERNDQGLVTILFFNHLILDQHKEVVSVDNAQPMFAELLHGGNVCNSLTLDADLRVCLRHPDMAEFSPRLRPNSLPAILWKMATKYKGVWLYILKQQF